MADDLPPGFKLDEPAAGVGSDLPPGFKLDEPPAANNSAFASLISGKPTREREIRLENLKKLMAAHSGAAASSGPDAPVGTFSAYTNRLKDAWTSGLARPMGAAMTTVGGEIGELFGGKPATLGERWRGGIGAEEDFAKAKEKQSEGVVGSGVSVLGSLASAGRAAKPLGLLGEMTRAGVQGGIEGGARNAESAGNALMGAGTGTVVNAGTTGVVGALLDRAKRVGGAARDIGEASRGGTAQSKAADAGVIFDRLDNAGVHFSGKETPALANSVNAVTSGPLPSSVRGEIAEVVQDINQRVQNGAMTFGDVRAIQSDISKLKANSNPDVRRVAKDMARGVDDFLTNAKPTMPASSVGTVSPGDLAEARRLYATSKHAGKVEGIAEAAATDAADPAKATASAFKSYKDKFVKNPDKFNPNTPDQRRLIDEIVTSGKGGAGADKLSNFSDYLLGTGGLATAGGVGTMVGMGDKDVHGVSGGASGAGAAMLGLGLLGKGTSSAMRQQLARTTAGKVDDLLRNIVTGSTDKTNAIIPRDALAILMAKQDLARGAGKVVTSNIDTE